MYVTQIETKRHCDRVKEGTSSVFDAIRIKRKFVETSHGTLRYFRVIHDFLTDDKIRYEWRYDTLFDDKTYPSIQIERQITSIRSQSYPWIIHGLCLERGVIFNIGLETRSLWTRKILRIISYQKSTCQDLRRKREQFKNQKRNIWFLRKWSSPAGRTSSQTCTNTESDFLRMSEIKRREDMKKNLQELTEIMEAWSD